MSELFHVLIDDYRDPSRIIGPSTMRDCRYLVIRTFQEAKAFVDSTNLVDVVLYLDNDLDETTPGYEGYDVLNAALSARNYPSEIVIVTSNPVARMRMIAAIEATKCYGLHLSRWVRLDNENDWNLQ